MASLEERIRQRAYERWDEHDRKGSPEEHWIKAEREVNDQARRLREHLEKVLSQIDKNTKPSVA